MTDATLPAAPARPLNSRRMALGLIALLTRPLRHGLRVSRWPVEWRAALGRASVDELAVLDRARRAADEERAIAKRLDELAGEYKRLLINALTRVGASKVTQQDGHQVIRPVRFHKPAYVTREAIYFQVDTAHLPHRVKLSDLYDPENVETLMAATNRVVQAVWDRNAPEKGFWYVIELKAGVRGIPRHVEYSAMLTAMAKTASRFALAVGRGTAGEPIYADLTEMPHLLVAGATGQGKSVWLEQALLTLAMRNTPKQLQLCIVDLKNGVELGQFKHLPHLIRPVIKEVDDVVPLLAFAKREITKRLEMFDAAGLVDIDGWNQTKRSKMPRLVLVIDELAELMLTDQKSQAEPLLARIAALGRGAGVHAMIATQRPESRVITGLIKANFTTRLAFACADQRASMVILDTGEAAGLRPRGRMIYMRGADKTELQGPYVSPKIISETVEKIIAGKSGDALAVRKRHDFSPEDFFRHALTRYPGRFPIRPIYEDLKAYGVTRDELLEIAQRYEDQEIEIDGDTYRLTGPTLEGGLKESRKLVMIAAKIPDSELYDDVDAGPMETDSLAEFQPVALPVEESSPAMPDAGEPDETTDPPEDE